MQPLPRTAVEYIEKEVGTMLQGGKMAEADVLKLEAKVRSMVVTTKKPESSASAARPAAASTGAAAGASDAEPVRWVTSSSLTFRSCALPLAEG